MHGTGRIGAVVGRLPGGTPTWCGTTDCRVERVRDVHVGTGRELRVDRESEQPAVPEVEDLGPEVGEDRRRRVREAVEHLDEPALLGDEYATVGRERERRRVAQSGVDDAVLEPGEVLRRTHGRQTRREQSAPEQQQHRKSGTHPHALASRRAPRLAGANVCTCTRVANTRAG